MNEQSQHLPADSTRRSFLRTSTIAAVGGAVATNLWVARSAHAAGNDLLRVGLIGCGGRGTGAADNALSADKNVVLTAMGDAFADRLNSSLNHLQKEHEHKVNVPLERRFVGFDAYQSVIDSGVDVVLLTTPPHFRAVHMQAAVAAGKHVFAEKPVAVDAPGVRSVLATAEEAQRKGLALVTGLCYRYDLPKRETIKRIHDGAVGDIVALNVNYCGGGSWMHPRKAAWSDMEWQLRNWPYFTWLSGDFIVEQHVHSLDKAAWVMKEEMPVKASGMGGRQVRTGPEYGHIFDHHAVMFEYKDGVRLFSYCRQQDGCAHDVTDHVMGSKGTAELMKHTIRGAGRWRFRGKSPSMYQVEHNEMFASIRAGKPINDGQIMAHSTMMGVLGRMASYTGQTITWEKAMASNEQLGPPSYEWMKLAVPPVAKPGITQFV